MWSLRTKILLPIAALTVAVSLVSAFFYASAFSRSLEKEIIARGTALCYALSKAAEDGIVQENLDLIKKAAAITSAPDVTCVQVYTALWDPIDAYPFHRLKDIPPPEVVRHFKETTSPFYMKINGAYDFYSPVFFSWLDESEPSTIGFVRVSLSSVSLPSELREATVAGIVTSMGISLVFLTAVWIVVGSFIERVGRLQRDIALLKEGTLPESPAKHSRDELGAVVDEFYRMGTAIKEKERRLLESETRVRTLFERVEHALFRTDDKGNIIECNSRFRALFGEVKELCDIMVEGEGCPLRTMSGQSLQTEAKAVGRGGEELAIVLSLYKEVDESGAVMGSDGFIIDVTGQRRLEETLSHAQKMEAIGTLAGGIAHDFNNMLQAVIGNTSLMKMRLKDADPLLKPVNAIEIAANRAANLTRQLLGFARGGKYITKPISLNAAVEDVIQIISRTIDRAVEVRSVLTEGLWLVEADKSQIEHVLVNLCINARDAMPEGGVLQIETHNFTGSPPLPDAPASRYVTVRVIDTGTGIDRRVQQRIFEPFFTTKEEGKGTGMGLAMAYGVIKNHGGFITVDSEVGKGTAFTLYLPASDKTEAADETKGEEPPPGKGTVLIVDDEDIVRDFGVAALSECGYTVIEASDGQEAVELYRQRKDEIDVVILDLIMPKMGGKETFERLKEINPGVRVLISSGYSVSDAAREVLEGGAAGFIQKPFDVRQLAVKVKGAHS
ncbi:MAG: response regulator [Nitrospirota bacterium]